VENDWIRVLKRGWQASLAIQVSGTALGLFTHIVIEHLLGASQYGLFTLTLTWVSVIAAVMMLGQNTAVLRLVPAYVEQRRWGELNGLRGFLHSRVFFLVLLTSLLAGFSLFFLPFRFEAGLKETLLAGCLLLPGTTLLLLNAAFHQSLKRIRTSGLVVSLVRPMILLALLAVFSFFWHLHFSAPTVVLLNAAATLAVLAGSAWFLKRAWPKESRLEKASYDEKGKWLRLGMYLLLMSVTGLVLNRADILILGAKVKSAYVGFYYAAVQIAALSSFGLNAVNTILAPQIAETYSAGDLQKLKTMVRRAARIIFLSTLFLVLLNASFGYWVLGLFGPEFTQKAYLPLLILIGGSFFNALCGPCGFLLTMTRYEHDALFIFGMGAVLNVVLSWVLIGPWGLLGASVANTTALTVWNIAAVLQVRKRLGVNSTIFSFASTQPA
jgi:O-antigen/teichoic acid export membrane protein